MTAAADFRPKRTFELEEETAVFRIRANIATEAGIDHNPATSGRLSSPLLVSG